EQQASGGAVAHTYTITTGASSMSVDQGTWGGMTFNIVDETGSPVSLVGASAQTSNSNIVLAQIEGDKVAVRGINEGDAKVTISYGGTSVTFNVTVNQVAEKVVEEKIIDNTPTEGATQTIDELPQIFHNNHWVVVSGKEVTNPNTFIYIADGEGGWTLKDGQTKTEIGGIVYVSASGEWVRQNTNTQTPPPTAVAPKITAGDLQNLEVYKYGTQLASYIGGGVQKTVYIGVGGKLYDFNDNSLLNLTAEESALIINAMEAQVPNKGGEVLHTYSISASSATVKAGASTEVLFTVTDESGNIVTPSTSRISGNMATVASSDSSIATVAIVSGNKLKISGESVGTANITINYGTASANFEVIVEAPDSVGAPAAMVNADELETLTVYRTEK
ncbi:MAG: pilus assembly protein N-terminal domain-containing protein, partial [Patescibacteria group bacterium]